MRGGLNATIIIQDGLIRDIVPNLKKGDKIAALFQYPMCSMSL